jgi:nucleoside-triphosphatase
MMNPEHFWSVVGVRADLPSPPADLNASGGPDLMMKENVLITGRPGSGKSTMIKRLLEHLPHGAASGFLTEEIRDGHQRVGFRIVTTDGREGLLAHVKLVGAHRVGRYGVDVAGFEQLVLHLIDPRRVEAPILVIDEIGRMECLSVKFTAAVDFALGSSKLVVATAGLVESGYAAELCQRPGVEVLELSPDNREDVFTRLIKRVSRR